MTNEEAIKWLENLKQDIGQLRHENLWPYAQAIDEIIDMLDEQEPRVITLDEIKDGESYWFQRGRMLVTRPVICVHREDDCLLARKPYITFAWQFGTFSWDSEDYGKTWRCWTAKPTDEQREAVKWDGSR